MEIKEEKYLTSDIIYNYVNLLKYNLILQISYESLQRKDLQNFKVTSMIICLIYRETDTNMGNIH